MGRQTGEDHCSCSAVPVLTRDPVLGLGLIAFALLLAALPAAFWFVSDGRSSRLVRLFVAAANLCLTAQLILRWWDAGHFPISNLYESLCFLAWGCTLTQLLVERAWPNPLVPAAATPMALGCIAFASFALPDRLQEASPLVPALRSSWLVMHVSVIMLSYAALLVGSLLSVAVLFTDRSEVLELRSSSIGSGSFRQAQLASAGADGTTLQRTLFRSSEELDSLSYRTITVGFLLLSVGLVSGAVWANEAWGSWWSWDPKETWAFITWLVYAAYLHTRLVRGWQGRKPALVASAGLVVIAICYIGVNLLGIGLHSYGWFLGGGA
ncbi:MAG: c-type cytochrome biogenesis protein CcsB [Cyanobacteriota bacterium]|jgi:cytochrome c-type biogenesis protein CcsB